MHPDDGTAGTSICTRASQMKTLKGRGKKKRERTYHVQLYQTYLQKKSCVKIVNVLI
jgi:hypothetical protein